VAFALIGGGRDAGGARRVTVADNADGRAAVAALRGRKPNRAIRHANALMETAPGAEAAKLLCAALIEARKWADARTALVRLAVLRPGCRARARRALDAIRGR
jgi:hypothetical protein